jgi:hypothetical protein
VKRKKKRRGKSVENEINDLTFRRDDFEKRKQRDFERNRVSGTLCRPSSNRGKEKERKGKNKLSSSHHRKQ